jgi:hypothetical protein
MFTEEKNTEQVLLTRIEFSPPFLRTKKQNDKVIEHILSVSVREKRRFGNYHEVLLYFLLFVVKNKKILLFFLDRRKTVFTTPLTRNTLSTNISTNIPNFILPLAVRRFIINRVPPGIDSQSGSQVINGNRACNVKHW